MTTMDPFDMLALGWDSPFPKERAVFYMERLADIPLAELAAAVDFLVNTQDGRRPSVAAIRRAVVERREGFPSDDVACRQALNMADWEYQRSIPSGATPHQMPKPEVHPTVLAAFRAAGVDHQPSFLREYRDAKERRVVEAAAGSLNVGAVGAGPVVREVGRG